jgi:DNA mismatch endonuclease (patch repair protein)
VFVHGCFWHQHDDPACRIRKSAGGGNQEYWNAKLARNVARDVARRVELESLGWQVLVIWECETRSEEILGDFVHQIKSAAKIYGLSRE